MATPITCAACGCGGNLKLCSRCRSVSYCSTACQRNDFKSHKITCRFPFTSQTQSAAPTDPLSLLHTMPNLLATPDHTATTPTKAAMEMLNLPELRMMIFSLLPARELLKVQQVCRSWFQTVGTEQKLQKRLFFAPGPGELIFPAVNGETAALAIPARNDGQVQSNSLTKRMSPGGGLYLAPAHSHAISAEDLAKTSCPIVLNPFFTSLWPQDRTNMTLCPNITAPTLPRTASWRRMQVTSPPTLEVTFNAWYTNNSTRKGTQRCPSTGKILSGVTLGQVADLLAGKPKSLEIHWMQIQGQEWWLRSADAVVVSEQFNVSNNEARPGVYVNPSNGIAFPGFV